MTTRLHNNHRKLDIFAFALFAREDLLNHLTTALMFDSPSLLVGEGPGGEGYRGSIFAQS